MADQSSKLIHVVVFPWLAFGHIIPYFELSKLIALRGLRVSFVSTSRNIDRLPTKVPPNLATLLSLIRLTLPRTDNDVIGDAEATIDVPYDKVQHLKKAFDGLQIELTRFLEASSPDWVIYDFAPYWLPPIAAKLGISLAYFSIFNASSGSFFGSSITIVNGGDYRRTPEDFIVPPKWVPFPSTVAYRLHEIKRMHNTVDEKISGVSDWFRFGAAAIGCDAFLVRSCREIESDWLDLMQELHQKPIVPVGLLPSTAQDSDEQDDDHAWPTISEWLDKQNKGSVVYVALGSEVNPSQDELTELALGFEHSGLAFFWALRKSHDSAELPDGFEQRTKGQGVVWTRWAPQVRILSHDSVGGFVTHCGWSSAIEGLQFGRPLLMLPFLGDQGLIARVLAEKKVGIEIPRDEEDGSLARNSVAESLRQFVVGDEGAIYREKAKEMTAIFPDQDLHGRYIDNLVEYFQKHRRFHKDQSSVMRSVNASVY
ncbi:putative UDP-rhamnose:rhamnosyltransferase 1 [Diospyros lotus]|uniref:putative UDP-rhamnose:rhamnosyltransferase 1 n=1 Tax=Diospyros lotus TaxID=55363 RepID=UPI002250FB46|nr:putative UDP-rhamnose:rhamnosyltransferase 1 [Diospyros lotus]